MSKLNKALEFIASHGDSEFASELQEGILGNIGRGLVSATIEGGKGLAGALANKAIGVVSKLPVIGDLAGPALASAVGGFAASVQADKSLNTLKELLRQEQETIKEIQDALRDPKLSPEQEEELRTQLNFAKKNVNSFNTQIRTYTLQQKGVGRARRFTGGGVATPTPSPSPTPKP
jgi:hypothetical protein